MITRWFTAARI
uniref:Uncharacterized protein n=1 Tax=Arundo donax TaxID=35708 RepID=A0A0A8Z4F3_ARUDO